MPFWHSRIGAAPCSLAEWSTTPRQHKLGRMVRLREFAGVALLVSVLCGCLLVLKLEPNRIAFAPPQFMQAMASSAHFLQVPAGTSMHPVAKPVMPIPRTA